MTEETSRVISITLEDDLSLSETVVSVREEPSGESIRLVDSSGHSSGTDQHGKNICESISGPTVKGEAGTKQTCEILMARLNMDGGEWVRVESATGIKWVDSFLHSRRSEIEELPIQVTKAYPAIWG